MTPKDREVFDYLAREIFDQVRAYYLALPGRDEVGWKAVAADPRKFNRVWRVMLGEEPSGGPPTSD